MIARFGFTTVRRTDVGSVTILPSGAEIQAVSPTLQAVADGHAFPHAGAEEDAALAVQKFARAMRLDLWQIFGRNR